MLLDFVISPAYATGATPAAPGGAMGQILMLVMFVAIFYFMLWRPQRKRTREHQAMMSALQKGDEVVTNGGILGKVSDITEDLLTVNIAENVEVRLQKHAVVAVLPKGSLKAMGAKGSQKINGNG